MSPTELIVWMQENLFQKWDIPPTEQLAMWSNIVGGHDEDLVRQAMRLHWQDRGSFTAPILKDLLAKIHELEAKAIKAKPTVEAEEVSRSLPEIIRRNNPAWGKVDNDFELILRYYRQLWWLRAKPRIDAADDSRRYAAMDGYERQIKEGCFNALSSLGMCERRPDGSWSLDYAKWASSIILDREDEFEIAVCEMRDSAPRTVSSELGGRMPKVDWPEPPKPAARPPIDLIRQLAVAEHEKPDAQLISENESVPTA